MAEMDIDLTHDWRQGADDFNSGRYWHAHEAWEQGWRLMPSGVERIWVQAMIQVAGVYVLLEKGRASGALSLAEAAIEKLNAVLVKNASDGLSGLPRIDGSAEVLAEVVRGLRADESCESVLATLLRRGLRARI